MKKKNKKIDHDYWLEEEIKVIRKRRKQTMLKYIRISVGSKKEKKMDHDYWLEEQIKVIIESQN